MTEPKKDDLANRIEQNKKKQSPPKSNPFENYKSLNNPNNNDKKENEPKPNQESQASKSPSSYSHSSKSRSREEKDKPTNPLQDKEPANQIQSPQFEPKQVQKIGKEKQKGQPQLTKEEEQHLQQAYFKTKMCPLYQKGACKKGSACNFAHGQRELRGLPNFRKTRLCIPFKNGQCPKPSSECKYAHGEAELRKLVYDYFPQKHQGNPYKYERPERSHDRTHPRRPREDYDYREQKSHRGHRDSRDRREYQNYRERSRDYREYRESGRDSRDRQKDKQRDRYNTDYQIRSTEMYPPSYGYMPNYNSAYMISPGMSGYGNPNQLYPPSSQAPGFGSSSGPSSFSGSGASMGNPTSSYGAYNYGYGFLPHNYSYNPSSV